MTEFPSGMGPPMQATLHAQTFDLPAIAARICERYRAHYPDEQGRYGDAGMAWCRHDNQHVLNWAIGAVAGLVDLDREIDWLARVLDARDFPLDRLAHDLDMAAEELDEDAPAAAVKLRGAAERVRAR